MTRCNTISIDINGLFRAIQSECYVQLNDVAQKVIDGFQLYILSDGAGRADWKENAAKEFKVLSEKITNDVIEMQVGIREDLASEAWHSFYAAQIMVALFGNHPPSGGMKTKPGEITFHDHMESMDESHAKTVWTLPEGYNWPDPQADKMLENAMKMTRTYFADGLKRVLDGINFSDYVIVTAG